MAEGGELRQVEQKRFSEEETEGITEKIDTTKIDRIDNLSFFGKNDDRDLSEDSENMGRVTRPAESISGEFWQNTFVPHVLHFLEKNFEGKDRLDDVGYAISGILEECAEFLLVFYGSRYEQDRLLEASDILYYVVLLNIILGQEHCQIEYSPHFFCLFGAKSIVTRHNWHVDFNDFLKLTQKLAKIGRKHNDILPCKAEYGPKLGNICSDILLFVSVHCQIDLKQIAILNIRKLTHRATKRRIRMSKELRERELHFSMM